MILKYGILKLFLEYEKFYIGNFEIVFRDVVYDDIFYLLN